MAEPLWIQGPGAVVRPTLVRGREGQQAVILGFEEENTGRVAGAKSSCPGASGRVAGAKFSGPGASRSAGARRLCPGHTTAKIIVRTLPPSDSWSAPTRNAAVRVYR